MNSIPLILLGLTGLVLTVRGVLYFLKLLNVKKWRQVEVVITRSGIKRVENPEVYVKIEYFLPDVEYSYDISGNKYDSNVISIDPKAWIEHDKKIVESYLESFNRKKICYVNPDKQSESVLSTEVSKRRLHHYNGVTISGIALMLLFFTFIIFNID